MRNFKKETKEDLILGDFHLHARIKELPAIKDGIKERMNELIDEVNRREIALKETYKKPIDLFFKLEDQLVKENEARKKGVEPKTYSVLKADKSSRDTLLKLFRMLNVSTIGELVENYYPSVLKKHNIDENTVKNFKTFLEWENVYWSD